MICYDLLSSFLDVAFSIIYLNHTSQKNLISLFSMNLSKTSIPRCFEHFNRTARLEKIRPKSAGHQPMARWSFGVLVYVILVGQFPIGQSRQTKSELTRNIIKVEKAMGDEKFRIFFGFRLDLVVISWDFTVLTGFSGFTQSKK